VRAGRRARLHDAQQWWTYVDNFAQRLAKPVVVTLSKNGRPVT
jgi:hypothetical protein